MPEDRSKFTTELRVEGAEETKAALGDVAAGQDRLTGESGKAAEAAEQQAAAAEQQAAATEQQAAATDKAAASTEDYTSILGRIHPALGALADAFVKGSRVAGDLAEKQIKLGDVTASVTKLVGENAAAIKLLGAGGAAAAAILFLISQVNRLKEEWAEANDELRKYIARMNEAKQESRSLEENIRDAFLAQGKALSNEEIAVRASKVRGATREGIVDQPAAIQALVDLERRRADTDPASVLKQARAREAGLADEFGRVSAKSREAVAADVEFQKQAYARILDDVGTKGNENALAIAEILRREFESRGEQAPNVTDVQAIIESMGAGRWTDFWESPGIYESFRRLVSNELDAERQLRLAKEQFGLSADLPFSEFLDIQREILSLLRRNGAGATYPNARIYNHSGGRRAGVANGANRRERMGVG